MQSEFFTLGFDKLIETSNKSTIKDFFTKQDRSGIYILHFTNGEYYVGLTTDVVKRFVQHRHHFLDIQYLSFKQVRSSELLEEEKDIVYSLEKLGKKFRDVNFDFAPIKPSMLDKVITPEEQESWLDYEVPAELLTECRKTIVPGRVEDLSCFANLRKSKYFQDITELFKSYILQAIPFPGRTEWQYWCCNTMPRKDIYATLTIDSEEVLIVRRVMVNAELIDKLHLSGLDVCFCLSKLKLFKNYSQPQLERKFPTIELEEPLWRPGRQDQQTVWMDVTDAMEFLDDADCLDSIKEYNLRLMRKGATLSSQQHCVDLADVTPESEQAKVEVKN
jgi:hypothetical protein